jgi:hypothetical protein
MNDAVAKGQHKPENPGGHFPDFHHQESRIKALEDALAKQRQVNEALLSWALGPAGVIPPKLLAVLRDALK